MNSIMFGILIQIVQRLAGGNLFDLIKQLVIAQAGTVYTDIPATSTMPALTANEQRKLAVKAQLYLIQGDLSTKIKSMGGWLLSLVIDAAVGKLRSSGVLK